MTVQHGEEGDSRATVLIPTINNPQELRVVLEHLLKDSDGTYDIVVIDSSSNSETSDSVSYTHLTLPTILLV